MWPPAAPWWGVWEQTHRRGTGLNRDLRLVGGALHGATGREQALLSPVPPRRGLTNEALVASLGSQDRSPGGILHARAENEGIQEERPAAMSSRGTGHQLGS